MCYVRMFLDNTIVALWQQEAGHDNDTGRFDRRESGRVDSRGMTWQP